MYLLQPERTKVQQRCTVAIIGKVYSLLLSASTVDYIVPGERAFFIAPDYPTLFLSYQYPIQGEKLMHKIVETVDWLIGQDDAGMTFESFVSSWFIGTKCSELKRGNMVELLAWTMFAKEWSTTSKKERKSIERMVGTYIDEIGLRWRYCRQCLPSLNPNLSLLVRRCLRCWFHRGWVIVGVLQVEVVEERLGRTLDPVSAVHAPRTIDNPALPR